MQAQDELLSPDKMLKLVPDRLKEFQQFVTPKAVKIKVGTLTYTLCERNFSNGKQSLKILLFDYKEAAIMYNQATKKWNTQPIIESDSIIERSMISTNCSGWESLNKHNKTAQIFLGICDRFFLMITGENVELDEIRNILNEFPLKEFPK